MLLASAGCNQEPKPSSTATLFNDQKVHDAMKALIDALEALESGVDDFDTTSWREVVPQVKADVGEVRSAVDTLRAELGYED